MRASNEVARARHDCVWVVWIMSGGCEGCTMAVLGATSPRLEELLGGALTRVRRVEIIHPALALEAGDHYLRRLDDAASGRLDPFVLVVEGSLFDDERAGDGFFTRMGSRGGSPITVSEWVRRLSAQAAAVLAVGTCATWGGVPAASGNVTGAMGLGEFLPDAFESRLGLPLINVPGCAPVGDNVVETLAFLLLHMDGTVPLDLDDQGRPRWLYREQAAIARPQLPWLDPHDGGETADCNVASRGWINRLGGCNAVGGACNGCTMPGFPDRYLPLAVPRPSA